MPKNHTLICKTEEDRLRYIRRHDLFSEMLEALKLVVRECESYIHDGYDGTRELKSRLRRLGSARGTIIRAEKEGLI